MKIATFENLNWTPGAVYAHMGNTPPNLPVSSTAAFLTPSETNREILLVEHAVRGWDIPGGHTEQGEQPIDALRREIHEETGVNSDKLEDVHLFGWFHIEHANTLMLLYRGRVNIPRTEPLPPILASPQEILTARFCTIEETAAFSQKPDGTPRIWAGYLPYVFTLGRTPLP